MHSSLPYLINYGFVRQAACLRLALASCVVALALAFAAPALFAAQTAAPQAAPPAPGNPAVPMVQTADLKAPHSLLPYLQWQHDPEGQLTIADMTKPATNSAFTPWSAGMPRQNGVFWIRLDVAPMPEGLAQPLGLLFGSSMTGPAQVWMLSPENSTPAILHQDGDGAFPLLSSVRGGTLYIRLPDMPHSTFAPIISPNTDELSAHGKFVHQAAITLLALSAFLCLGRGLFERQEWRIWGGMFAVAVLIHSLWGFAGMPEGRLNVWDLPGFFAPGLALFALPQAGRHLMYTREGAPGLDTLLLLVSLVGFCLSVVPLLPGLGWTVRYTPLWPLALLPLSLCILAGRFFGLPAWGRFWLICMLPVAGLYGYTLETPAGAWSLAFARQLPLIALALSALLLAFVRGQHHLRLADLRRANTARGNARVPGKKNQPPMPQPLTENAVLPDIERAVPAAMAALQQKTEPQQHAIFSPAPVMKTRQMSVEHIEQSLRPPLDALLRQAIALDHYDLPEVAKKHVSALVAAGREINTIITHLSRGTLPVSPEDEHGEFDLPSLLRAAHDSVASLAETRNLALSWYMAPHLTRRYRGPAKRLSRVLTALLESSINATEKGSVQLWARRAPESNDPGCILFTVADTGTGSPPERRSSLVLAKAWEMAGEGDNALHVDSGPLGASISFVVHLQALTNRTEILASDAPEALPAEKPALRIILADDVPSRRQLLAYLLEDLPHEVLEARSAAEAVLLHGKKPAQLVLVDGNMPEEQVIEALGAIRSLEGEKELPKAHIIALVANQNQADLLSRAGCDHVLFKPVIRAVLKQMVLHLAPIPGMELPPLPATVAVKPLREASQPLSLHPETKPADMPTATTQQPEKPAAQQTPVQTQNTALQKPVVAPVAQAAKGQAESRQPSKADDQKDSQPESPKGFLQRLGGLFGKKATAPATSPASGAKSASAAAANDTKQTGKAAYYFEPSGSVGEPQPITKKAAEAQAASVSQSEGSKRPGQITPVFPGIAAPRAQKPAPATFTPGGAEASSGEWVGEPMPVVKNTPPTMPAQQAEARPEALNRPLPAESAEWVGEPMPIVKKSPVAEPEQAPTPWLHQESSATIVSTGDGEWVGEPIPLVLPMEEKASTSLADLAIEAPDVTLTEQQDTLPLQQSAVVITGPETSETPAPVAQAENPAAPITSSMPEPEESEYGLPALADRDEFFEQAHSPDVATSEFTALADAPADIPVAVPVPETRASEQEIPNSTTATETATMPGAEALATIPVPEQKLLELRIDTAPETPAVTAEPVQPLENFTPLSMEPDVPQGRGSGKSRDKKPAFRSTSLLDMIELEPASKPAKASKQPEQGFLPLAWPAVDGAEQVLPLMETQEPILELTDKLPQQKPINHLSLSLEPEHTTQQAPEEDDTTAQILFSLNAAIRSLEKAVAAHSAPLMLQTAQDIAAQADVYGLHVVAGLARCVEMAAQTDDMEAVGHLVPDLQTALERNVVSFSQMPD